MQPHLENQEFNPSSPLRSFANTVKAIVTRPVAFFRDIPARGSFWNPFLFAAGCTIVGLILSESIYLLLGDEENSLISALLSQQLTGEDVALALIGIAIVTPFVLLFILLFVAIQHLFVLMFVGRTEGGFRATWRVSSYAAVPALVPWIPYLGYLVSLFGTFLFIVGVRELHYTSTRRAVLAALIPTIFWLAWIVWGMTQLGW